MVKRGPCIGYKQTKEHVEKNTNTLEDVWKYINKKYEDCWIWKGSISSDGYGRIVINHKIYRTHRLIYEMTIGKIPDGLLVCHSCDNPLCCNPEHLFLGTYKENTQDMISKGRKYLMNGELNNFSKLTEKEVIMIREIYSNGKYFQRELGEMFGVSKSAIYNIIHKITWKHIC